MSGTDYTLTPNLGLYKPIYDHDIEMWGTHLNANADKLDSVVSNQPIVSVLNNGAKGDGATDDTAAIQAVLNANAGKAIVLIPVTGSPYIVTGLTVPSNSQIIINGTLRLANGAPAGGILQIVANAANIAISGTGTLDGNATNQTAVVGGITSAGNAASSEVVIRDINIINSKNWPLNITRCTNGLVENVTMNGGGSSAEFALASTNCWFVGCSVANVNDLGVGFYGGPSRCGVVRCDVSGCYTGPFALSDNAQSAQCSDLLFAENTVHGNTAGILISSNVTGQANQPLRTRIIGNTCFSNTGPGINVGPSSYTLVEGNICYGNSYTSTNPGDIVLGSATAYATVVGNYVFNTMLGSAAGFGIYLNLPAYSTVMNNRIEDSQTTKTLQGAIGGTAGQHNATAGNIYGTAFVGAADQLSYANSSTQGWSYDAQNLLYSTSGSGANYSIGGLLNMASGAGIKYGGLGGTHVFGFTWGTAGSGTISVYVDGSAQGNVVTDQYAFTRTSYANDAAASAGGVPVGGLYRNGSALMVRMA